MKVERIETHALRVPLKKPFVTAKRTALEISNLLVMIHTDTGECGYGEAAAVAAVTGETEVSITEAVHKHIAPAIHGMGIEEAGRISARIQAAIYGNPSAKSAVECAVYDLFAQHCHMPLFRVLGGARRSFENDVTISAGTTSDMVSDCMRVIGEGYRIVKIKLGKTPGSDGAALSAVWRAVNESRTEGVRFRVDANQGWHVKEAVRIIRTWEDEGLPVELVEQPVPAWDTDGLQTVTRHTQTVIMADESVFNARDAARLLASHAADMVNIKLAKAGGVINALKIADLCETYGVECMMGCMLESRLGASAAAHIAASRENITKVDLDGPALCRCDPFTGGPVFIGRVIGLAEDEGIGVRPSEGI